MNLDFRDLFAEFNAHGVEYLVVGRKPVPPLRIDILTSIDGVQFEEAWLARVRTKFADEPVGVLAREHLIKNKRCSGRLQDLADLEKLEGREKRDH